MKTKILIENAKGISITISIEHDEAVQILPVTLHQEEQAPYAVHKKTTCLNCGRQFIAIGDEEYCLPSCREKHMVKPWNSQEEKTTEEKSRCKWCGMTFDPEHKLEKYCSESCRHESKKDSDRISKQKNRQTTASADIKRNYPGKTCPRCGRYYIPTGGRQLYCRPDCKPLTSQQQQELDDILKDIKQNQNKTVL